MNLHMTRAGYLKKVCKAVLLGAALTIVTPAALSASVVDPDSTVNNVDVDPATIRFAAEIVTDHGLALDESQITFSSPAFESGGPGHVVTTGVLTDETISVTVPSAFDVTQFRCGITNKPWLPTLNWTHTVTTTESHTQGDIEVTVEAGKDITCTAIVNDKGPELEIRPILNGGQAKYIATQVGEIEFNSLVQNRFAVQGGEYPVSSATPGYRLVELLCNHNGGSKTTHRYVDTLSIDPASVNRTVCWAVYEHSTTVTLEATVINDHGGSLDPNDIYLTVKSIGTEGAAAVVSPGTSSLHASVQQGYKKSNYTCTDNETEASVAVSQNKVTLSEGQHVTCTITYNDIPGRITFRAVFDGESTDARLVFGDSTVRHNQFRTRGPGDYVVDALNYDGYTFDGVTCTTGSQTRSAVAGEAIRVNQGERHYCQYFFTKDIVRVVFKVDMINDDGGTLTNTHPRVTFGQVTTRHNQFRKLASGQYSTGAIVPNGYELAGVECVDQDGQGVAITNGVVTGEAGMRLTCTYTFDDVPVL